MIGAPAAKAAVNKLTELFELIPVDEQDCLDALALPLDDFEDALIVVCSAKSGADYIVTRDMELLCVQSHVRVISPDELAKII